MRRLLVVLLAIAAASLLAVRPAADPAMAEPAAITPTVPSMLLPWDRKLSDVKFTSGPHAPPPSWTCNDKAYVARQSGLDFGMTVGHEVLAAANGRVARIAWDSVVGNRVVVYHGGGFATEYWHLSQVDPALAVGLPVTQGTVVGLSGQQNGQPHLHLEFDNWSAATSVGAPYSADGILIDGFTAHTFVLWSTWSSGNPLGFNYRGTLVKGSPQRYLDQECGVQVAKWRGVNPATDTWEWGSSNPVKSNNPKIAQLVMEVALEGIGLPPNNNAPKHPERPGTVQVFNSANALVIDRATTFVYSPQRGTFLGSLRLTSTWPVGWYSVKVRFPTSLRKWASNAIQIGASNTKVPTTKLLMGDINGDNVLNLLDYNIFAMCYRNESTCTAADRQASDLDDDGDVDAFDYNIWFGNLGGG